MGKDKSEGGQEARPHTTTLDPVTSPPIQVGDIVRIKTRNRTGLIDEARDREWEGTGIVIDTMEMEDGFCYYECAFGMEINWFQDLTLEVLRN